MKTVRVSGKPRSGLAAEHTIALAGPLCCLLRLRHFLFNCLSKYSGNFLELGVTNLQQVASLQFFCGPSPKDFPWPLLQMRARTCGAWCRAPGGYREEGLPPPQSPAEAGEVWTWPCEAGWTPHRATFAARPPARSEVAIDLSPLGISVRSGLDLPSAWMVLVDRRCQVATGGLPPNQNQGPDSRRPHGLRDTEGDYWGLAMGSKCWKQPSALPWGTSGQWPPSRPRTLPSKETGCQHVEK